MAQRPEERLRKAVDNVVKIREARAEAARLAEEERRRREQEARRERP